MQHEFLVCIDDLRSRRNCRRRTIKRRGLENVQGNEINVRVLGGLTKFRSFSTIQKKFNKNYQIVADGGKRDRIRKENFFKSYERIQKHNSNRMSHYSRELNRFSDMVSLANGKILIFNIKG